MRQVLKLLVLSMLLCGMACNKQPIGSDVTTSPPPWYSSLIPCGYDSNGNTSCPTQQSSQCPGATSVSGTSLPLECVFGADPNSQYTVSCPGSSLSQYSSQCFGYLFFPQMSSPDSANCASSSPPTGQSCPSGQQYISCSSPAIAGCLPTTQALCSYRSGKDLYIVDIATDVNNCGGCNSGKLDKQCQTGQLCVNSACTPCPGGNEYAWSGVNSNDNSPVCVNLFADPNNCRSVFNACDGEICENGFCTSCSNATTYLTCNGQCTPIDKNNCGACGTQCSGDTPVCALYGSPPPPPGAPLAACCGNGTVVELCETPNGLSCVDTTIDPNNCGGCGQACKPNELCQNQQIFKNVNKGECVCPAAQSCGNSGCCPVTDLCVAQGTAQQTCCPMHQDFNGYEVTIVCGNPPTCTDSSLPKNCGACSNQCKSNQVCTYTQAGLGYSCQNWSATENPCPISGPNNVQFIPCGGVCVDPSQPANCGGCASQATSTSSIGQCKSNEQCVKNSSNQYRCVTPSTT